MFSIAATLPMLDIAVHPPGTPLQQVLYAWPAYLAYVISFLTIGAETSSGPLPRSSPLTELRCLPLDATDSALTHQHACSGGLLSWFRRAPSAWRGARAAG